MPNERVTRMRSDIRDRDTYDIAYNTKLTLLAVNSINALQELAKNHLKDTMTTSTAFKKEWKNTPRNMPTF